MAADQPRKNDNPELKPSQVARLLKVNLGRVYGWIKRGKLPARRIAGTHFIVLRTDAMAMIADHKPPAIRPEEFAGPSHEQAMARLKLAGLVK